jgi:hypothetical protein
MLTFFFGGEGRMGFELMAYTLAKQAVTKQTLYCSSHTSSPFYLFIAGNLY